MPNLGRSFIFLVVGIMMVKLFLVSWGNSYITSGSDPPRLLAQIQYALGSGNLQTYVSPRILLHYFSFFEQLILEISPQALFFGPLFFIYLASLITVYLLAQNLWGDEKKAGFASLLYALVLTIVRITYSTMFTFWLGPLVVLLFFRFLFFKESIVPLAVVYLGALLTYSPLLFVINIFLFITTIFYLNKNPAEAKRVSWFFFLMPVIFGLIYPFDSRVVLETYITPLVYVSRSLGLWISPGIIPLNAIMIYAFLLGSCTLGFWLKFFRTPSINISPNSLLVNFFRRLFVGFAIISLIVFTFDFSQVIGKNRFIEEGEFISYYLFSNFFGQELWRDLFWPLAIVYFFGLLGWLTVRRTKNLAQLLFYGLIIITPIVGTFLKNIAIFDLLSNERGLRLVAPFVCILSAGVLPYFLKKGVMLPVVFTFLFVTSCYTILNTKTIADWRFFTLADWYRKNVGSTKVFVASLDNFPIGEPTETYYSLSLIPWNYPFWYQSLLNNILQKTCYQDDFFIQSLINSGYQYIVAEPYYVNTTITEIPKRGQGEILWGQKEGDTFKNGAVIKLKL